MSVIREKMEEFLTTHESRLDLPRIEEGSGHTIFEFVPNDAGTNRNILLRIFSDFWHCKAILRLYITYNCV